MSSNLRTNYTNWLETHREKLPQMWEIKHELTDKDMFEMFYQEYTANIGSYFGIMADIAYQIQEIQKDIEKINGDLDELHQ